MYSIGCHAACSNNMSVKEGGKQDCHQALRQSTCMKHTVDCSVLNCTVWIPEKYWTHPWRIGSLFVTGEYKVSWTSKHLNLWLDGTYICRNDRECLRESLASSYLTADKGQDTPDFLKSSPLYFHLQNGTQALFLVSHREPLLSLFIYLLLDPPAYSWLPWIMNARGTPGDDIDVCLNVESWSLGCSTHHIFVQPGPIRSLHEW